MSVLLRMGGSCDFLQVVRAVVLQTHKATYGFPLELLNGPRSSQLISLLLAEERRRLSFTREMRSASREPAAPLHRSRQRETALLLSRLILRNSPSTLMTDP
ncbi:unnamed protein product [Boreogadus saida]